MMGLVMKDDIQALIHRAVKAAVAQERDRKAKELQKYCQFPMEEPLRKLLQAAGQPDVFASTVMFTVGAMLQQERIKWEQDLAESRLCRCEECERIRRKKAKEREDALTAEMQSDGWEHELSADDNSSES